MEAIVVYNFDYRAANGEWVRGPVAATLEAIQRYGWRVVEGSGRQVFAESVASNGVSYR